MAQVNYLEILERAWKQHIATREPSAPTVISTFAGCGGSSLGYSMAGFRELLAIEWNDNAVETFKLNFPGVLVYHGDIHKLSVEECLRLTGLQPGQLDLLDGSPPCQGFSTAGKRKMEDKRNQLYMQFVRLLRGLQPKVFVMENVSGLVKGKMKLIFADIMKELKASGYQVRCKLLNAMYFNVPQKRQRLIFIGVRDDLRARASFPRAQDKPIDCFQVFIGDGKDISQKSQRRILESGRHRAMTRGKVSPTLKKRGASMQNDALYWTHNQLFREVSSREKARLSSFPDTFVLKGDKEAICERIGNSVPPLMMKSIASHIKIEILANA